MTSWNVKLTNETFSILAQKFGRNAEVVKGIILDNAAEVERVP